jgi:hypothetical protein
MGGSSSCREVRAARSRGSSGTGRGDRRLGARSDSRGGWRYTRRVRSPEPAMKTALLVLATVLTAIVVQAQGSILSGCITDVGGGRLSGSTITVWGPQFKQRIITQASGCYTVTVRSCAAAGKPWPGHLVPQNNGCPGRARQIAIRRAGVSEIVTWFLRPQPRKSEQIRGAGRHVACLDRHVIPETAASLSGPQTLRDERPRCSAFSARLFEEQVRPRHRGPRFDGDCLPRHARSIDQRSSGSRFTPRPLGVSERRPSSACAG